MKTETIIYITIAALVAFSFVKKQTPIKTQQTPIKTQAYNLLLQKYQQGKMDIYAFGTYSEALNNGTVDPAQLIAGLNTM